jgi:non-specific serine/threonine protein kinase
VQALAQQQLLLILDNCEHLLDTCVWVVGEIISGCPGVRIVVTSQDVLNVTGEVVWRTPPLTVPDAALRDTRALLKSEAVQLFVDRASAAVPGFALNGVNADGVAQICRRLDGLPLAIELAAARVRSLSVDQLVARLDERFRLLTGGSRTALPRQQTLRAAVEWSHDLLDRSEQILFRRLAAFVGGWTLEVAETICAAEPLMQSDILELLSRLVDKSLVLAEHQEGGMRYRLLESLRQYGAERMSAADEDGSVRRAHAEWVLALSEAAAPELSGRNGEIWMQRLTTEHDNIRAALAWCTRVGETGTLVLLCGALGRFWEIGGYFAEGRRWLERGISIGNGTTSLRARLYTSAGTLAWHQADYAAATELHGGALELYREADDHSGVAFALNNLGAQALQQGLYVDAQGLFEQSLELAEEAGEVSTMGYAAHNLGEVARHRLDFERSAARYTQALQLFEDIGDRWGVALNLCWLGVVTRHLGDYKLARKFHRETLRILWELGDRGTLAESLEGLAAVEFELGEADRAAVLCGAAEGLRARLGTPLAPVDQASYETLIGQLRLALNTEYERAWNCGASLSVDDVIRYAIDDSPAHLETHMGANTQDTCPSDLDLNLAKD